MLFFTGEDFPRFCILRIVKYQERICHLCKYTEKYTEQASEDTLTCYIRNQGILEIVTDLGVSLFLSKYGFVTRNTS